MTALAIDRGRFVGVAFPAVSSIPTDHPLTLMILDDDLTFCKIAERHAEKENVRAQVCRDLEEARFYLCISRPDAVILDFQLDPNSTSLDHLEAFGETPVLLTSQRTSWIPQDLPGNVRTFVPKDSGALKIVQEAIRLGYKGGRHFPII